MKNKKGFLNGDWAGAALGFAIVIVTLVVVAIMLGALQSDTTANSYEYNITGRGLTFIDNATSKFGTAGTILGVMVLLGIIGGGGFLAYRGYQKLRG